MPSSLSTMPETITQQQLRTFHISGRGIEQAMPHSPLHPVELDGLELKPLDSAYPVFVDRNLASSVSYGSAGAPAGSTPLQGPVQDMAEVEEGWLIPFGPNALPLLYAAAAAVTRGAAKRRFIEKLARQCERLRELLRIDDSHSPAGSSPEVISASMGTEAAYFNTDVLASAFHRKTDATAPMDAKRRERVEAILATIEHAIDETNREPLFWLFHSATASASVTALGGRLRQCGDSFDAALEFCDQRLDRFARYLRALRAARLEVESAFDPAVHEEWLQRFDWQSADPEELAALPAFVVLEPAEWLARTSLTSFGRLLRSGRPVQILVPYHGLQNHDQGGDLSGFMPDFGYLSMAHREAFVLQSSLARTDHLMAGLSAMAGTLRPAVAVVSVPPTGTNVEEAWRECSLLHLSRAFPLYCYDPDRGETWMERFELLSGTAPGRLNAAHVAAVSNDFRRHFRIIPDSDRDGEQVELAEYLERYRQTPPLAIPFLRVLDERGQRRRAAVTRELVNLCRDRQRAYRILEELAGVKNAHVEAAVVRTREEVHTSVRLEGATEAIHRVIAMLTDGGAVTAAVVPTALAAPQAAQTPAVQTAAQTAVPEETDAASEDPYIDTFLCTSCNDCMKVNPLLFRYDANKQASIADARAGTFAELVKAAEGCPAKCIHPGTPRADDASATPQVRAKAAKFR